MPRKPKPWYWPERNQWCVVIHRKTYNLGKHPEGAKPPKKKNGEWNVPPDIMQTFHKLMSQPQPKPASEDSVAAIIDEALVWHQDNRARRTFERYRDFCEDFCREYGHLPISDLTSRHVSQWLQAKDEWGPTTKRNAIIALNRMLNFAVQNLGLPHNPCRGMSKPKAKVRTEYIPPEEFETILRNTNENFGELLVVSWDCGCRPQEVKELEARHIEFDKCRWVLPTDEAKGKREPRAVYIPTERSMDILRRRAMQHPAGKLFRSNLGNPWTAQSVKCAFQRIEKKTGKRYRHYAPRHSSITNKLLAGVDSHIVAKLAGHTSSRMIDQVYSSVAEDHAFMLQQARRGVTAEDNGNGVPLSEQQPSEK